MKIKIENKGYVKELEISDEDLKILEWGKEPDLVARILPFGLTIDIKRDLSWMKNYIGNLSEQNISNTEKRESVTRTDSEDTEQHWLMGLGTPATPERIREYNMQRLRNGPTYREEDLLFLKNCDISMKIKTPEDLVEWINDAVKQDDPVFSHDLIKGIACSKVMAMLNSSK